jgi:hypothetical protein
MIKLVVHPGQQSSFGVYPLNNIKTLLPEQNNRLIRHAHWLQSATDCVLLVWILESDGSRSNLLHEKIQIILRDP